MPTDRELKLQAAREKFQQLSAPDSGIRRLSEANRENGADTYSPQATMNAFDHTLKRSVSRLSEIAARFTQSK